MEIRYFTVLNGLYLVEAGVCSARHALQNSLKKIGIFYRAAEVALVE
jgi:hypothetical protein